MCGTEILMGPDDGWKVRQAKEDAQREAELNTLVSINGVSLKVRDIFPDWYDARKFITAITIIDKAKGGGGGSSSVEGETKVEV